MIRGYEGAARIKVGAGMIAADLIRSATLSGRWYERIRWYESTGEHERDGGYERRI
jgi:hypothetical protein